MTTMRKAWALRSILLPPLSAPIAIAAMLAVSLPAANETVNQYTTSASPSDPIPNLSSTPYSVPGGNSIALHLLNANHSLPFPGNFTANIHFHIPDTLIDLVFTLLGRPLSFTTVSETVELAIDDIATNVNLHPAESITNGVFRQVHDGVTIRIRQYTGKEITWSLLNELLLGMIYFTSELRRSCELRFEIEFSAQGRVGHGSIGSADLESKEVAKGAVNGTSKKRPVTSIPKPPLTNSTHSLLSTTLYEISLIFSYHFYGPSIPEPALSSCFTLARQSIRTNVQLHPQDALPDGLFQYRADGSGVSIGIKAYADKEISWRLLDRILQDVGADLTGGHLWACDFEFEFFPSEELFGHGSLEYSPAVGEVSRRAWGGGGLVGLVRDLGRWSLGRA